MAGTTSIEAGLGGLTVIEVSRGIEGAFSARLLADAGANVIKIEDPDQCDPARRLGPFPNDQPEENSSGLFHYLNVNKQSVTLNLRSSAGKSIFAKLIAAADIFISDYPFELDDLGLTHKDRSKINIRLIDCSITPFGLTGPYRQFHGDDIVILSLGGLTAATPGFPDFVISREKEGPLRADTYVAGFVSGAVAATAVMTALFARLMDDKGRQVDVSQQEAVASTMIRDIASYSYAGIESGRRTEIEQSGNGFSPNIYLPCKDGMVVLVTASEDGWKQLVKIMGSPAWAANAEYRDTAARAKNIRSLASKLVEWAMTLTGAEITETTQSNGLPCAHVLRIPELVDSSHIRERGALVDVVIGAHTCRMPAPPFQIKNLFGPGGRPAPRKGEHNVAILTEMLGYAETDLVTLRAIAAI